MSIVLGEKKSPGQGGGETLSANIPQSITNVNLSAALDYLRMGWHVMPLCWPVKGLCGCGNPKHTTSDVGKAPMLKTWTPAMTVTEAQIRKWWTKWPDANIAVLLESSGLADVDLDSKEAVAEALLKGLPFTPKSITGNGEHHFFARTDHATAIRRTKKGDSKKIDVLASGYALLPPSTHRSGVTYTWEEMLSPDEVTLAPLPEWAVTILNEDPPAKAKPVDLGEQEKINVSQLKVSAKIKSHILSGAEVGERSGKIYAVIRSLMDAGYGDNTIGSILLDPENLISEKPLEKGKAWTSGEIGRARAKHEANKSFQIANDFKGENFGDGWMTKLEVTEKGGNRQNHFNVQLILSNDEVLKGKFTHNTFSHKDELTGKVPWSRVNDSKEITDHDDSGLTTYLSTQYEIASSKPIKDVLSQICLENQYHPVRDYLSRLQWDGIQRLDTLLIDYFNANNTELIRMQTRLTLVGAVKRVFQPGCKMDYVLTLQSPQGIGKSTFLEALAIKPEWFSDSLIDVTNKDAMEHLQGKWIIELGEMAAVSKGDQKRNRQFISSVKDTFRVPYGHRTADYPRQCIFVASTNDDEPLKDETGGRRWWIVKVYSKWFEKERNLHEELNQIWAEAMHVYADMEREHIPLRLPNHLEAQAKTIQTENTDRGVHAAEIEYILQEKRYVDLDYMGTTETIDETCAFHIWEKVLRNYRNDFNSAFGRQINAVLKDLDGWECIGRRQFKEYGKQYVYRRIVEVEDR